MLPAEVCRSFKPEVLNRCEHSVQIPSHVTARDAQYVKSLRVHPRITPSIALAPRSLMICAINFDHEPRFMAVEVGDEGAERVLASEAKTGELSSAKV